MTPEQLVAEVVPELPAELRGYVLWNYTAYPFHDGEPEAHWRGQLAETRQRWLQEGKLWDPMEGAGGGEP